MTGPSTTSGAISFFNENRGGQIQFAPPAGGKKLKPEPTGKAAEIAKKQGFVWDPEKGTWKKPEPGRYEVTGTDPQTGDPTEIKTPDGKTVKKGEPGFNDAKDKEHDQRNADADKAWSEQVTRTQQADQDARNAITAQIRQAQKDALEKMKDPDPNVQAQGRAENDVLKNGQHPAQQELKNLIDQQKQGQK